MKFAIITHAVHKKVNNKIFAYRPYVLEMNLWSKYVDEIAILSPISKAEISKIEKNYTHNSISISSVPSFDILNLINKLKSIFVIPIVIIKIFKVMFWADHIHLRCPGNIGLLGCFVQVLFPFKPKTVKYAGNWDHKSKQPVSYRLQKWIVSNTFLTRNCKVLVYGNWNNQSKNIIPFFTASYSNHEIEEVPEKKLNGLVRFIFVGTFSIGKQPMLSVKTIEELVKTGKNIKLDMFGDGKLFDDVMRYVKKNSLENYISLHGNQPKEIVKKAFQKAHFLIFISKSEGWPKVVAEAMFWSCLPISSRVSCVPNMLDEGKRGILVTSNTTSKDISNIVIDFIERNEVKYSSMVNSARQWSQNFTLDKFESEIKKFI